MTAKLIVAWKTRAVEGLDKLVPAFTPPANYKDQDRVNEWLAAKREEWLHEAATSPYTGTFDEVMIVDSANERPGRWYYKDRGPGGSKAPICVAVRNWLMKLYPTAWPDDTHPAPRKPEAIFLGFEPRGFLKLLGIECSLPENCQPLPVSMWYGNTEHRDITEACIPKEYGKLLPWALVFKRRGIKTKEGWQGPGQDPEEDVRLVTELATQLGFLRK